MEVIMNVSTIVIILTFLFIFTTATLLQADILQEQALRSAMEIRQPINDFSCNLRMQFSGRYQNPITLFMKVFVKRPKKAKAFIYWREPISGPLGFPIEPLGLTFVIRNGEFIYYELCGLSNETTKVIANDNPNLVLTNAGIYSIANLHPIIQNILAIAELDNFVCNSDFINVDDNQYRVFELIPKNRELLLWGHKITKIRCWLEQPGNFFTQAQYYDSSGKSVAEFKGKNPMRLENNQWAPQQVIMTIVEGAMPCSSDLAITVVKENMLYQRKAEEYITYPKDGRTIHRFFQIIDNRFYLPSKTLVYTGNEEILRTTIFENYQINQGISDDEFNDKAIFEGVKIPGEKGEYLEALALFHKIKRETPEDIHRYNQVIEIAQKLIKESSDIPLVLKTHHLLIDCFAQQKNDEEQQKIMQQYLNRLIKSASGQNRAANEAFVFAQRFIQSGQFERAEEMLAKYVELLAASHNEREIYEIAEFHFVVGRFLHALKLYEFLFQQMNDTKMKQQLQLDIATCYDMLARDSTIYRERPKRQVAFQQAVDAYEKFMKDYPQGLLRLRASHNIQMLTQQFEMQGKLPDAQASPSIWTEEQLKSIISYVRKTLRQNRQWQTAHYTIYADSIEYVLKGKLPRDLTDEEFKQFQEGFAEYCQLILPRELPSDDALAIELANIRFIMRRYLENFDLAKSEISRTYIGWQMEEFVQSFDNFITEYLHDDTLLKEISNRKKEFRTMLRQMRTNVLCPSLKKPLNPKQMNLFDRRIRDYAQTIDEMIQSQEEFLRLLPPSAPKQPLYETLKNTKHNSLSYLVEKFLVSIAKAHGPRLISDEFHPEKQRSVQYHYLPKKGIKITILTDKSDYPKLGIK